ncbi:ABC transporter permease, partial [candidate division KSB1 bacterium]
MIKNFIVTALRNAAKQKIYTIINVSGIAIGMACCILILLYIKDELSYDKYHENADNIYRVVCNSTIKDNLRDFAIVPAPVGPAAAEAIPEITTFVRLLNFESGADQPEHIKYDDKDFDAEGVFGIDSTFFNLFSYKFIKGDPKTALEKPGSIVITEQAAILIFGDEEPIGKVLNMPGIEFDLEVTGVIENVPRNSHFTFNYLISMSSMPPEYTQELLRQWLFYTTHTYVLVEKKTDPDDLKNKINEVFAANVGERAEEAGIHVEFFLQKLTDIHLRSNRMMEIEPNSDIRYIYAFSLIAFFILFIACVNFINLSTARSANRAREVGLRKVFGGYRTHLIGQFLTESVILSVSGLLLSVILVSAILPLFNNLTQMDLSIGFLLDRYILLSLAGIVIFTGIIAGSYPAFYLSGFKPVSVFHRKLSTGNIGGVMRRVLVVGQFSISIALIICTIIVLNQVRYMKNSKLGFDKEQMLVLPLRSFETVNNFKTVKELLSANPNILDVSFSSSVPGKNHAMNIFVPEGGSDNNTYSSQILYVDKDFADTYKLEIIDGQDFREERMPDSPNEYLINESAARMLGWENSAVGKRLTNMSFRTDG